MSRSESEIEQPLALDDLIPTEILDRITYIAQTLDNNAPLSLSLVSSRMFAGAQHCRTKILLPGLLRKAGIDQHNMINSFNGNPNANPLNSALLEASIERFGYIMVLQVYYLLELISRTPLMQSPTYIREARELLKRWKNHLFKHCGALGYFVAIADEYNTLTRNGESGITHYPESGLKILRHLYAFRYLLEKHYKDQSVLHHFVRMSGYETGASKCDVIRKKSGELLVDETNFKALEDEITENLPLTGTLAKYQTIKILRLNVKEEAFKELQELGLVEQDTPNPYLYF